MQRLKRSEVSGKHFAVSGFLFLEPFEWEVEGQWYLQDANLIFKFIKES